MHINKTTDINNKQKQHKLFEQEIKKEEKHEDKEETLKEEKASTSKVNNYNLSTSKLIMENENLNEEIYLNEIKKWLEDNPNIKARNDKITLLYFLRGCKYDLERTKTKIESFYLMRAQRTEWFSNRDPFLPEIQELLKIGVFLPLHQKDNEGRLVVVIRAGAHDPKLHLQNNVFKTGKMILDLILKNDESFSSTGVVAIIDMKDVQLGHALQMTPSIIKRSVESWQIYPCKLKLLEFVNAPIHINVILNTFRFFMTQKMKSRIVVRKTSSKIDVKLPKDQNGDGESYCELAKYWKNKVEQNVDFYKDDEQYKTIINDKN